MSDAKINEALTAQPNEVGHKVFVGNLAFATTGEDLKQAFASAGTITNAQVITRGARSLGYGFLTLPNNEEATKIVSTFDKTDLNGRTINVEIAKPAASTALGEVAKAAANAAPANADGEVVESTGRRGRGRGRGGRGRGGARGGRRPPADGEADGVSQVTENLAGLSTSESAPAPVADAPATEGASGRGGRRGRGGRGGARGTGRRAKIGPPSGEPSKTLLFVANLSFSLDDDGLRALFEGYTVKSAHVVKRKSGPSEGRSKGFGFVELADEEQQQKALAGVNGKEVDGRAVQVKVANDRPENEEEDAQAKEAAAAAASS